MMPAGNYYIGDLCYALTEAQWNEVCTLTENSENGEFTLSDGTRIAIYSTAYGDGTYIDYTGRQYPVDSGSIGCVLTSAISKESLEEFSENIVIQSHRFSTSNCDGTISFGSVFIDTKFEGTDVEDDYYEDIGSEE